MDDPISAAELTLYVLTGILGVAAGTQWLRSHLRLDDDDPKRWRAAQILTAAAGASLMLALAVAIYVRNTHFDCCYMLAPAN